MHSFRSSGQTLIISSKVSSIQRENCNLQWKKLKHDEFHFNSFSMFRSTLCGRLFWYKPNSKPSGFMLFSLSLASFFVLLLSHYLFCLWVSCAWVLNWTLRKGKKRTDIHRNKMNISERIKVENISGIMKNPRVAYQKMVCKCKWPRRLKL